MVMILRTLLFPIDNGMGKGLSGDGYSAEYDVWTGKVTWRKATKETIEKQKSLTSILMIISASLSPFVVAGLLLLVRQLNILGSAWSGKIDKYAPIILGVILFLAFEALMLAIRVRDPLADAAPPIERQHEYFKEMFDFAIRKNIGGDRIPPYVGTYLSVLVALLAIPLSYYFYLHSTSSGDYLEMLFVTSVLVSLFPNFLWNGVLKHIIYLKLIRKTKGNNYE
ncbi:hypothetical protein [Streptococcus intermedius]|uniref:hypothetical protein n=1 Tax=Streptococcus intermedius TaxID=1338 RepID=UPI001F61D3E2|nr:hypothetical protein [Streptococcus intermedius]MCI3918626.1 hypothetical protein [Streptococcus intermedius]